MNSALSRTASSLSAGPICSHGRSVYGDTAKCSTDDPSRPTFMARATFSILLTLLQTSLPLRVSHWLLLQPRRSTISSFQHELSFEQDNSSSSTTTHSIKTALNWPHSMYFEASKSICSDMCKPTDGRTARYLYAYVRIVGFTRRGPDIGKADR